MDARNVFAVGFANQCVVNCNTIAMITKAIAPNSPPLDPCYMGDLAKIYVAILQKCLS